MNNETKELIEPVLTETLDGEDCSPQEVHSGDKLGDCYLKLGSLKTVQVDACADFSDPALVAEIHPIPGKGYVDINTNQVWIYNEEQPEGKNSFYPIFWFENNGLRFTTITDEMKNKANVVNMVCLNLQYVLPTISNDSIVQNQRVKDLLSSGSSMVLPIVKQADDGLKKMVKCELREIRMSLSNLPVIDKQHQTANMSSALKNGTKMSVPYFHLWRELLKREAFVITGNLDPNDDGYHALVYNDSRDMVGHISDQQYKELLEIINSAVDDEHVKILASLTPEEDEARDSTEVINSGSDDDEESQDLEE